MDTKVIGNKIAQARKEANMSQAQLAQQLFISPQAVGKWERGESVPDIITINRLAEILGVDLNYFSESFPAAGPTAGLAKEKEEVMHEEAKVAGAHERPLLTNFNGSNLAGSDFAGVSAHNSRFNGSALRGSDFSGADLTGSSFKACDAGEANFDGANLTDCSLFATNLANASFNKTVLVRTEFSASEMPGAKFTDANLVDVQMTKIDIRKAIFENCTFDGVDFDSADLRGVCFDGQSFTDVKFDNTALNEATFNGATLKNVSFHATFAITNKYYRALKTIHFDGAKMDKLTYAALKGMGAELSQVTVV